MTIPTYRIEDVKPLTSEALDELCKSAMDNFGKPNCMYISYECWSKGLAYMKYVELFNKLGIKARMSKE